MTAMQIIDEIKRITLQECGQVSLFFTQFESPSSSKPKKSIESSSFHYADDSIVEEASERIFNCHAPLLKKLAL